MLDLFHWFAFFEVGLVVFSNWFRFCFAVFSVSVVARPQIRSFS